MSTKKKDVKQTKASDGKASGNSTLLRRIFGQSPIPEEPAESSTLSDKQKEKAEARKARKVGPKRSCCWSCCSGLMMTAVVVLLLANLLAVLPTWLRTTQPMFADIADGLNDLTVYKVRSFLQKHGKVNTLNGVTMLENATRSKRNNMSSVYWRFNSQISQYALYTMETTNEGLLLAELIQSMAFNPIVSLESMGKLGSEWKMFGTLTDSVKVVFKPARMRREEVVDPNLYYFSEKERHTGEIAAFHLDRILGFNRVPPCVGRTLNITSEILPFIDDQFVLTIHRSPDNNICFYGQCMYLCDLFHPICGNPDTVEFSACSLIPHEVWRQHNIISPWRRAYMVKNHKVAEWEMPQNNDSYCQTHVLNDTMYNTGRRLADLIDLHIFDFLTGNQDRHSYFVYRNLENDSSMVNYDNGRGFGRPYLDDTSILAPLYQCCQIRQSTYEKLVFLGENKLGVKLSSLMRRSLATDPLSKRLPLLTEPHLQALDRRVKVVLDTVIRDCMIKKNLKIADILVNDGF